LAGASQPAGADAGQQRIPRVALKTDPRTERFPKASRLLCGADYDWVFAQAERSRDALFTVLARWRGDTGSRLGMAVSKKAARRAVDRNRIKRLVREGFRQKQEALGGLDIVVIARQGIGSRGTSELRRSMDAHWSRLKKVQDKKTGHLPQN
jgi:ribonuclease P protein component